MSHMVRVNTQIKNLDYLVGALVKLGFSQNSIKRTTEAHNIQGYYNTDSQMAHVSIPKVVAKSYADIGWEKQVNGDCIFHRDSMDHKYGPEWQNRLMQTYSEVTVEDVAQNMGFSVIDRQTSNGEVQLVLQRC